MKIATILSLVIATFIGTIDAKWSFGWCPTPALQSNFDKTQYVGSWYEIARDKDILFEYGECVQAQYSIKPDGNVGVINSLWNAYSNRID